MFSEDTTEKTTSNTDHLDDINTEVFDWVTDRIETLKKSKNFDDMDNSTALEEEFSEWITANKEDSELDCMYWNFRGLDKTENL
jgi:hypothetical protein